MKRQALLHALMEISATKAQNALLAKGYVEATSFDLRIRKPVEYDGKIAVVHLPGFLSGVMYCPSEELDLVVDAERLEVVAKKYKRVVPIYLEEWNYCQTNWSPGRQFYAQVDLSLALKACLQTIGVRQGRPDLERIQIHKHRVFSTNGVLMVNAEVNANPASNLLHIKDAESISIPPKLAAIAAGREHGEVALIGDLKLARFEFEVFDWVQGSQHSSQESLIERFDSVMARYTEMSGSARVDSELVKKAASGAAGVSKEESIEVRIQDNSVVLRSISGAAEFEAAQDAATEGEASISLNPNYLTRALRAVGDGTLLMSIDSTGTIIKIQNGGVTAVIAGRRST